MKSKRQSKGKHRKAPSGGSLKRRPVFKAQTLRELELSRMAYGSDPTWPAWFKDSFEWGQIGTATGKALHWHVDTLVALVRRLGDMQQYPEAYISVKDESELDAKMAETAKRLGRGVTGRVGTWEKEIRQGERAQRELAALCMTAVRCDDAVFLKHVVDCLDLWRPRVGGKTPKQAAFQHAMFEAAQHFFREHPRENPLWSDIAAHLPKRVLAGRAVESDSLRVQIERAARKLGWQLASKR